MIPKPETNLARFVQVLGVLAWLLLIASQLFYWSARPHEPTFLDRRWGDTVRETWDLGMVDQGMLMLKVCVGLCSLGFTINLLEHSGRGTHFNRSLIIVNLIAACLLLVLGR